MNLKEIGSEVMEWTELAWDRIQRRTLVTTIMNPWVPWKMGYFLISSISFSRRTLLHGINFCPYTCIRYRSELQVVRCKFSSHLKLLSWGCVCVLVSLKTTCQFWTKNSQEYEIMLPWLI